ncbi:MAG: tRNA (guanosine(46)-N7)-methyltransferase TrmB [Rhizobiaceae bacterium]
MGGRTQKSENASHGNATKGSVFGRRKAKPLRKTQAEIYHRMLPGLLIDVSGPAPANLRELFPGTVSSFVLEIGFGGGEHLVHRAQSETNTGFIGCEPFINGMAKALVQIEANAIDNIRVFDEDAALLLDWLPENSLSQVDLLYPDPWPKKRHWKRRFVNSENLRRIHRALKPGGEFRFASDIADYVEWTQDHVAEFGRFDRVRQPGTDEHIAWDDWYSTRYEKKAVRQGREPSYLVFRCK